MLYDFEYCFPWELTSLKSFILRLKIISEGNKVALFGLINFEFYFFFLIKIKMFMEKWMTSG